MSSSGALSTSTRVTNSTGATISGAKFEVGTLPGGVLDGSGRLILDLSARFADLDGVWLQLEVDGATVPGALRPTLLLNNPTAGQASVRFRRSRYDKTTAVNGVTGQPAGVTLNAGNTLGMGGPSATANPIAGAAANVAGPAHSHGVSDMFDHAHLSTAAATDFTEAFLPAATDLTGYSWSYVAVGT